MYLFVVNTLFGIILATMRIFGCKDQIFQAIAHIYVGSILTASYLLSDYKYLILAVILSIIEVICFFIDPPERFKKEENKT